MKCWSDEYPNMAWFTRCNFEQKLPNLKKKMYFIKDMNQFFLGKKIKYFYFRCGCPDGFVLHNIYQECVDANECLGESQNDHNACGSAKCQNSFGSFTCLCPNGYSFNGNLAVCVQSSSGKGTRILD